MCRTLPVFKTDLALRSEAVIATVAFFLPTPGLQGGHIHFTETDGGFICVRTAHEAPTLTIVGSYVDVEQTWETIYSPGSHRMALVYGIHAPLELRPADWPSAERLYSRQNAARHLLARWKDVGGNSAFIHVLEDQSDEFKILKWGATYRTSMHALRPDEVPKDLKNVKWEPGYPLQDPRLKGKDGAIVRALYPIAKELGLGMYMASLEWTERPGHTAHARSLSTEITKLVRVIDDKDKTDAPMPVEDRLVADVIELMPPNYPFAGVEPDSVGQDGSKRECSSIQQSLYLNGWVSCQCMSESCWYFGQGSVAVAIPKTSRLPLVPEDKAVV